MRERLTISHVGAQGDGVAPGPVFVPLTLAGEVVEAEVRDGRAGDVTLLTPSPERQEAPCPHFGTCGGCALQHWQSEPYLAWKGEQVRLALGRQGLETDIRPTVGIPPATRRRLALHASSARQIAGAKGRKKARRRSSAAGQAALGDSGAPPTGGPSHSPQCTGQ